MHALNVIRCRNPGFKTIESELLDALVQADAVRPDHIEQPGLKVCSYVHKQPGIKVYSQSYLFCCQFAPFLHYKLLLNSLVPVL